ncbi:MAG: cytochrome c-type biogenesis protein CcmH [Kangiellaceae bacterium]|nr:cytochrome c-type biogenesis protein CcmH [Kangiellaceae bacterium]MCW8999403.1 cytochrome c-type biogenesis protein CcmH [Kangiellaceae bacterium]
MNRLIKSSILLWASIFISLVSAEITIYEFDDPELELRFNNLSQELRCPKCQNNNLADSDAPLAVDLKDIVYEKMNQGQSDEQIVGFLKERYGDFITYRPPVKPSTWLIWFGPFVLLLGGFVIILRFVSNRKESTIVKAEVAETSSADLISQWAEEAESEVDSIRDSENQKN